MNPNRREVITTLSGAAAFAMASSAFAQAKAPVAAPTAAPGVNKALIDAAMHCVEVGLQCEQLCVASLSTGDKMMAECMGTVRQMLPACQTVAAFARQGSSHLKEMAALCAKICRECEKACKKHEAHHEECKACAESCARCATECEKV